MKDIDRQYYKIVKDIINHPEYQKRKQFKHHHNITVYDHCLNVSKKAYKIAKVFHADYESAAIAGLLHDFYEKPWQEDTEKHTFFKQHGFTHAQNALDNSNKYFKDFMNPKIENAIKRHMFPLNIVPPKHCVGWIVTLADKMVSLEVFKSPRHIPRLLGIKRKKK